MVQDHGRPVQAACQARSSAPTKPPNEVASRLVLPESHLNPIFLFIQFRPMAVDGDPHAIVGNLGNPCW